MLNKTIDIKTLNARTGITVRLIRYVLDHELVPDRTWMADEHAVGRARVFGQISAVFIATAAYLLLAGYKRDGVRDLITAISKPRPNSRNSLNLPVIGDLLVYGRSGRAQFADGQYVRWVVNEVTGDWVDSQSSSKIPADWIPKVTVEINISAIRDQIFD